MREDIEAGYAGRSKEVAGVEGLHRSKNALELTLLSTALTTFIDCITFSSERDAMSLWSPFDSSIRTSLLYSLFANIELLLLETDVDSISTVDSRRGRLTTLPSSLLQVKRSKRERKTKHRRKFRWH